MCFFIFVIFFIEIDVSNSVDPDQTPGLIWVFTICISPKKKDAVLIRVYALLTPTSWRLHRDGNSVHSLL